MKSHFVFFILAFHLTVFQSMSQEQKKLDTLDQKNIGQLSYAKIGIGYSSDYVYAGRKDSLKAPYLTPAISYYHKSGLFVRGYFSYLTAPGQQRIDMYGFTGGYTFMKNNFYGGISGGVTNFNDSSYAVQSNVGGNIFSYAGYDFDIIDFSLDATLLFSGQTDIMLGADLSNAFFMNQYRLTVIPTVYVMAGTQQFYNEYFNNSSSGNKRGRGSGGGGTNLQTGSVEIQESTKFQLLAFEFSLPVYYRLKKFRFYFNPTYVIPMNPSTIQSDMSVYKEQLANSFYWTAGIGFLF